MTQRSPFARILPSLFFCCLLPEPLPAETWSRTASSGFAPQVQDAEALPGGGILVTGRWHPPGGGGGAAWILALDPDGEVAWETVLDLGNVRDAVVLSGSESGIVLVGGTGAVAECEAYAWVTRLDMQGAVLWEKAYGGVVALDPSESALVVRQVHGDRPGLIVGGLTSSRNGAGWDDPWIFKLRMDGTVEWEFRYPADPADSADSWGQFSEVLPLTDGGYLVAGPTRIGSAFYAWVVRLDPDGELLWQRFVPGASPVRAFEVDDPAAPYRIVGQAQGDSPGRIHAWIAAMDDGGDVAWSREVRGFRYMQIREAALSAGDEPGLVLLGDTAEDGSMEEDLLVLRTDLQGVPTWQRRYGTPERETAEALALLADGDLFASVRRTDSFAGWLALWLLRLDPQGLLAPECGPSLPLEMTGLLGDSASSPGTYGVLPTQVRVVPLASSRIAPETAVDPACSGVACPEPGPRRLSDVRSGAPALRVLRDGRILFEHAPEASSYNVYVDDIGSWYQPGRHGASTCDLPGWSPLPDGLVEVRHDLPVNTWVNVTASNACGEGPAGRDSGMRERTGTGVWDLCGYRR